MQKKILTKNSKKTVKSKAIIPKAISKKTSNPVLYYQCMSECCQKGLQGQKITQIARRCKENSPVLITQRTKQVKELQKALAVVSKFAQSLEKVFINH